ncbi:MAG: hypothetical protein K6U80_09605 [Firmicutes bacterium]|nr:hypothetical protein [Bacillota bacterium]
MDKSELKRAIARSTSTGFNQTAYSELAASQEELNSQICKEAQQERSRRELKFINHAILQ